MLSHFHFACAGSVPLWTTNEKSKPLHGITAENAEYLAFAKEELARQGQYHDTVMTSISVAHPFLSTGKFSKWQELSMYQDDGYYCYQLLSQNWRGNIEHAGEVDDFTEEDFLSSSTT